MQRYSDVVFRTALVVTGDRSDAEDVAQDAFVKAYGALGRFRPGAPLRPWLLRIVGNEARNRRRASGRALALSLRAQTALATEGVVRSPELVVEAEEERMHLLRCLNNLEPEQRRAVQCRYLLELDTAETANALRCASGTVKSRLSRALRRLRACMEGHG